MNLAKLAAPMAKVLLIGMLTVFCPTPFADGQTAPGTPIAPPMDAPMQTPTGTLKNVANQLQLSSINLTGTSDATFSQSENRYPIPADGLSDTTQWSGFCRQGGRQLTFNLGTWKNISAVSLDFEQNTNAGIYWPSTMTVEISQDGTHWGYITQNSPHVTQNGSIETLTVVADQAYMSAYMRITFPVSVWVFARNLVVWHDQEMVPSPVTPEFDSEQQNLDRGLLTTGHGLTHVHHALLVYTGANGHDGTWSTNDYKPMLSYYDQHGIAESRMFDTMLFLPYGSIPTSVNGWSGYLSDLFAPNGELANLNEAAAQAGQDLHNGLQENVILSLPYPDPAVTQFGPVEPGGKSLDFSSQVADDEALSNREQAVQWYYSQLIKDWKQANYPNLRLEGVYWNDEAMNPDSNDVKLSQFAHQLTSSDSLPLLWIPYYGAPKVYNWNNYGFDAAILQPNYYELTDNSTNRMNQALDEANNYGLGLEFEVDYDALKGGAGASKYQSELQIAGDYFSHHTSNVVSAFYDGSKVLLKAYGSTDPSVRSLYDATGTWLQRN